MSFAFPVRVYWEDTDAGGIVFYANYLKYMERARTEWLRSLGIAQRELRQRSGGMFVVSETRLKYHRPARLDDELLVSAALRELGTASLIIDQTVLLQPGPRPEQDSVAAASTPVVLCEGTIRIGWVRADTLRPARLPTAITGTLRQAPGSMAHAQKT